MRGALAGDVIGSVFERRNIKRKDFKLFHERNRCSRGSAYTDDGYLTAAVANAFLKLDSEQLKQDETVIAAGFGKIEKCFGKRYHEWVRSEDHLPYGAITNGAIMRCSPAAWVADSTADAHRLGGLTAMPTHNDPQAVNAAGMLCEAVFRLAHGAGKAEIRSFFETRYTIPVIDEIRPVYTFDTSCDGTLPVAVAAFLESDGFEDAIRTSISVGGDSDTIAAVCGSLAEAYYGVPEDLWEEIQKRILPEMAETDRQFRKRFM